MDREELKLALKNTSNSEFFDNLENYIGCKILPNVKNILILNGYGCASSMNQFDNESIQEIEVFMRTTFNGDMLEENSRW